MGILLLQAFGDITCDIPKKNVAVERLRLGERDSLGAEPGDARNVRTCEATTTWSDLPLIQPVEFR